jgi:signal transduction histidine kinase
MDMDLLNAPCEDKDQFINQLARIVEVSLTLNSTLDPEQLLQFIIKTASDLLDCEAASIMLYDEKRGELFFAAAAGSDPKQLASIPVPLEGSIAGTIFLENRPLIINNAQTDPRHYAQVGEQINFQTRTLLGVPMRIRSRVTGVLEALNKRSGEFTAADTDLLTVIASQAAVAIQNARLIQALQKAYDELSRVDKLKSDFISIASHELRTPLGVLLGYATFLQEDSQGQASEMAAKVLNSALKLRELVEAMTNLNLIQVGSTRIDLKPIAIQQVVQVACKEIQMTAEVKNQKLLLSLPEKALIVQADAEKLKLVFVNMLNNAVRFTQPDGEIHVSAYPMHNEAWVEIRDNGVGIPAGELENIFKDFYQVEDHMTRRVGGLGLGLSIARGIVKLHNGRIWAESPGKGQGATFRVVLPSAGATSRLP